MKRDKLLIEFILITLLGIVFIYFVYSKYIDSNEYTANKDIKVPEGYSAKVILKGLKNPSSIVVDESNDVYIAENFGDTSRLVEFTDKGNYTVIANNIRGDITSIILHKNDIYISIRGAISKLVDGKVVDIVNGLPSFGDYSNNGIAFGYDGLIYVCQGSATNSGIVGLDNFERGWVSKSPYFHDYPPVDSILGGVNFKSPNPLTSNKNNKAVTGAFLPFNTYSVRSEAIKGRLPGNACILRLSSYGVIEDVFAFGIRNPVGIAILPDTRVLVSVQGMENRGSRPIANGKDYLYEVTKGSWLGWPDYEGGEPVILNKFKPKGHSAPQFIMELHPTTNPPKPLVSFNESGRIGLIDISSNNKFGYKNYVFIPFKKGEKEKAKVIAYDLKNNKAVDFMTSGKDSNYLENLTQCSFSKDGKLYVLESSKGILIEVSKLQVKEKSILPGALPLEYFIAILLLGFVLYLVFSAKKDIKK